MKDRHGSKSKTAKADSAAPKQTNSNGSGHSAEELYNAAVKLAEQSQPEEALVIANKLWTIVQSKSTTESLPALNLLGEISLELGDATGARAYFEQAAKRDPNGDAESPVSGGAEKFLWLAQLCETGGKESVSWFDKGAVVLRREIAQLQDGTVSGLDQDSITALCVEKRERLAHALCGIIEVYMTDLSWEEDAEERCENLITEAMGVEAESSPEVLQTLASIRLSQDRGDDARAALRRSYGSWKDLDPDDDEVPEFATRISLSRLLMEAEMEDDAMEVLERLVSDDDQSVEAWYLGGWCQYLIANRKKFDSSINNDKDKDTKDPEVATLQSAQSGSRIWLTTALRIYDQIDYEDDRLKQHAHELVADLNNSLGQNGYHSDGNDQDDDDNNDETWEGLDDEADDDDDEEMRDV